MSKIKKKLGGMVEGKKVKGKILFNNQVIWRHGVKKDELMREFGLKVWEHFGTDEANKIYAVFKKEVEKQNDIIKKMKDENERHKQGLEMKENPQFGVPPDSLPAKFDKELKIPTILLALQGVFIKKDGFRTRRIFLTPPNKQERDAAKVDINRGASASETIKNVHVAASLLMSWFRDLQEPILGIIGLEKIKKSQSVEEVEKAHKSLDETYRSILIWLWDFLVDVSEHSDSNEMEISNLAMAFAPCLYNFQDPKTAMNDSPSVRSFCLKALEWRKEERKSKTEEERKSMVV